MAATSLWWAQRRVTTARPERCCSVNRPNLKSLRTGKLSPALMTWLFHKTCTIRRSGAAWPALRSPALDHTELALFCINNANCIDLNFLGGKWLRSDSNWLRFGAFLSPSPLPLQFHRLLATVLLPHAPRPTLAAGNWLRFSRLLAELHRDSLYPMMGTDAWVAGADRREAPGPKPVRLGPTPQVGFPPLRLRRQPPGSGQLWNGGVQRGVTYWSVPHQPGFFIVL